MGAYHQTLSSVCWVWDRFATLHSDDHRNQAEICVTMVTMIGMSQAAWGLYEKVYHV